MAELHESQLRPILERLLADEAHPSQWADDLCVGPNAGRRVRGVWVADQKMVVAGVEAIEVLYRLVDPGARVLLVHRSGDCVEAGSPICSVETLGRSLLRCERLVGIVLGRLCGIATRAWQIVEVLGDTSTRLLDSRDGMPSMRALDRAAVLAGGAMGARAGLSDAVRVRHTHYAAAGGISAALERLSESLSPTIRVEAEAGSLAELQEAIEGGAGLVLLSGLTGRELAMASRTARGRTLLVWADALTAEDAREAAAMGVDFVSTRRLVFEAPRVLVRFELERENSRI